MASQQVQLREAIASQITALVTLPSGAVVESRRIPRVNADELEALHVVLFLAGLDSEIIARQVDRADYVIGIAIQQQANGDAIAPVDSLVETAELIRALWHPGGALREATLANCYFKSLEQPDIYDPQHLLRYGVFTAILELTYSTELE